MGLLTVLGLAPRGFFIPHRYADTVDPIPYPEIGRLFGQSTVVFAEHLDLIDTLGDTLAAIGNGPPPAPRWSQGWFAPLDAAAAYAMVRHYAPPRIIEVGSGHSTRFLAGAVADAEIGCAMTAIDPSPRASIAGLPLTLVRATVQQAGAMPFAGLAAGDLLFIDSSHILMPGTDVDWLLNRILPSLPAGVLVHVHDIFLPDPYPASWSWRGYNEQTAMASLLANGRAYEVLFASHYVMSAMADRLADSVIARLPRLAGAVDSSLWLRKL